MERSLRIIAISLALLHGAGLPAGAQDADPSSNAAGGDALCEPGVIEHMTLDQNQQLRCRRILQTRIDEMRRRNREHVQRVIEDNRQRRALEASLPPPPPPPVTVESFIGRGDLAYGDVVVTDRGPRVFIGKGETPPTPQDFVALDSSLSPHRGSARQYDGAFPERHRPQPAKQRPTPREFQERQP